VQSDDPEEAARAAHRFQQENPAQQASPARDPAYQAAFNRRTQERGGRTPEEMRTGQLRGGGRDIPVPEFLRGPAQALQNFNRDSMAWQTQMPRNLGIADEMAWASTLAGQGTENLIRRARGQEIEIPAMTAARAAADWENQEGARVRREQPGQDALANAANIVAFAGTPAAAAPVTMLQAGIGAAGTNAPFALARQEGDLMERLPGAAQETALVFGLGAGLQGLGNAITRQPPRAGRMVDNADRLGIPVNAAMTGGPLTRSATKLLSENIFAGGSPRRNLTRSMEGTRDAAQRTAASYGRIQEPEGAGSTVQRALRRYSNDATIPNPQPMRPPLSVPTREWSRASKARAVFDEALRPVETNRAAFTNTSPTLQRVLNEADSAAVNDFQGDRIIQELIDTVQNTPTPTLRDMRVLRRKIRAAQEGVSVAGQTVDNAALRRLEGALSEDMYAAAGPQADALRRADAWYRRSKQRMDGLLEVLAGDDVDPMAAYNTLTRWSSQRTANSQGLASVRSALRDDEWRSFVASYVNHMGQPSAGASGMVTDIGFSVHNWARAHRNMTPAARRIFFGGAQGSAQNQLMRDLDDLAEIALSQKSIENMGTPSGRDVQNLIVGGLGLGALQTGTLPIAALGVVGMAGVGELLTSTPFVRWLTSASRGGPGAGGMRRQLSQLAQIAARDPAVVPYYEAYLAQLEGPESRAPAMQPAGLE
jgi:hypothetical protein